MEYIGDVLYDYASGLYVNLTNRCPCSCEGVCVGCNHVGSQRKYFSS